MTEAEAAGCPSNAGRLSHRSEAYRSNRNAPVKGYAALTSPDRRSIGAIKNTGTMTPRVAMVLEYRYRGSDSTSQSGASNRRIP